MFRIRVLLAGALFFVAPKIIAAVDQITVFRPIPDVGEPFDVKALLSATMPYRNNAITAYRHAAVVLEFPFDSLESKKDALVRRRPQEFLEKRDDTLANGWSRANDDVRCWLRAGEDALEIWKRGTECTDARKSPAD